MRAQEVQQFIIIEAEEMEKEYKKKRGNIYLLTRASGSTPVAPKARLYNIKRSTQQNLITERSIRVEEKIIDSA